MSIIEMITPRPASNWRVRFGPLVAIVGAKQNNCLASNGKVADNLKKAGWSWGWSQRLIPNGRTIWIADAHPGDGKRFVVPC